MHDSENALATGVCMGSLWNEGIGSEWPRGKGAVKIEKHHSKNICLYVFGIVHFSTVILALIIFPP